MDTTTIILLTVVLAHFIIGFVVLVIKLSPKKKDSPERNEE